MLLAIAGLYALEARARLLASAPRVAQGWGLFGAVLLFLSLDEIGSLHEEIAMVSEALGLGTWTLVLGLGAALGVAVLTGILRLWQAGGDDRRSLFLLLLGFGLLATVPVQEFVEHAVDWGGESSRLALRAAIEEGTELVGMLTLVAATALRFGRRDEAPFDGIAARSNTVLTICVLAAPVALGVTFLYEDIRIHGNPAAWVAAFAWFAAAAVFVSLGVRAASVRAARAFTVLAILCVLGSVASVAVDTGETIGVLGVGKRAALYAIFLAGMAIMLYRAGSLTAPLVALAVAAMYLIAPGDLLTDLAFPLGFGLIALAFAGAAHVSRPADATGSRWCPGEDSNLHVHTDTST